MNQYLKEETPQVFYQGRWVDRGHFRTFVYGKNGKKLANSYDEYSSLIESGLWFSTEEEINKVVEVPQEDESKDVVNITKRVKKAKHGTNS